MIWPQVCYNGVRVLNYHNPSNVRRLDLGSIPMTLDMQANGILISKSHFAEFSKFLQEEKDRLTEEVYGLTGYRINIGSPDQIEALLFRKMKLNVPKHFRMTKSEKRYQVDDESLSSIKGLHPCVPLIQQFTECHKLKSSYADVLPIIADKKDGRVRTNLRVTRQVGGRISSSDPNLMAQPTRSDLGKRIRAGFIAEDGWSLGTIDQSQIEMRVAAHRADCISMIDTFLRNGDIHVETAVRIFFSEWEQQLGRMPDKKQAKEMGMDDMRHRYPAKRIGFGILFGIMAEGLQDQIFVADDPTWTEEDRLKFRAEWPIERCQQTIELWYEAYPEIRSYMSREHANARRTGKVCDMWGRVRLVPQMRSCHKRIAAEGARAVGSMGISSSAQGTMKLYMAEAHDKLVVKKYKGLVRSLLQIHDEYLCEIKQGYETEFLEDCKKIMENVVRLNVPIRSSYAFGPSWGSLDK